MANQECGQQKDWQEKMDLRNGCQLNAKKLMLKKGTFSTLIPGAEEDGEILTIEIRVSLSMIASEGLFELRALKDTESLSIMAKLIMKPLKNLERASKMIEVRLSYLTVAEQ